MDFVASTPIFAVYDLCVYYWYFGRWNLFIYCYIFTTKMITALIIAGLLFFPSPIDRDPSRPHEIALTQWGEAWIGVAHNTMAGGSFYEADTVRVLVDNEWRYYNVVTSGVFLCDTPRPNCNDAVFIEMYEPGAVILVTCYPLGGMTRGQWIIKLMPVLPLTHVQKRVQYISWK